MPTVLYFGDEARAAGWRLAGVACHTPVDAQTLLQLLSSLPEDCALVLIEADQAARLPPGFAEAARRRLSPLFLELPAPGQADPAELGRRVQALLGMDT
mgnify:CR=1 FL=1